MFAIVRSVGNWISSKLLPWRLLYVSWKRKSESRKHIQCTDEAHRDKFPDATERLQKVQDGLTGRNASSHIPVKWYQRNVGLFWRMEGERRKPKTPHLRDSISKTLVRREKEKSQVRVGFPGGGLLLIVRQNPIHHLNVSLRGGPFSGDKEWRRRKKSEISLAWIKQWWRGGKTNCYWRVFLQRNHGGVKTKS